MGLKIISRGRKSDPPNSREVEGIADEANNSTLPCTSSDLSGMIMAPPLGVDNQADYFRGCDTKQKNVLFRVLDILKGARPGSDLTSFKVPAQFNLPKSQLQCYAEQVYCCGQNLMEQCADGATPLDRFIAVVRWHISLVRPAPFLKAPYNPILGETHHVSAGDLNLLAEQVSHHPPISAVYATNTKKGIQFFQLCRPVPRFWGNSIEVNIFGRQILTLAEHGETYEMTPPKLAFRFLPYPGSEWTGETLVRCAETGLEAVVSFKPRSFMGIRGCCNKVSGNIKSISDGKVLYTFCGSWDKTVTLEDKETVNKSILYDGQAALSKLKTPVVKNQQAVSPMDSVVVWSKLTESLWNQDWEAAREAKMKVEDNQRALRRKEAEAGEEPKYFTRTVHEEWEWNLKGHPVPESPIVWEVNDGNCTPLVVTSLPKI